MMSIKDGLGGIWYYLLLFRIVGELRHMKITRIETRSMTRIFLSFYVFCFEDKLFLIIRSFLVFTTLLDPLMTYIPYDTGFGVTQLRSVLFGVRKKFSNFFSEGDKVLLYYEYLRLLFRTMYF